MVDFGNTLKTLRLYCNTYFTFICLYLHPNDLAGEFVILIIEIAVWSVY